MEEKEKFKGFDDTGWDNIEKYTKNWIKIINEETKDIELKKEEEYPNIPEFLKENREKNK